MEKICRKCGFKSDDETIIKVHFHKDSSKAHGYANICKSCKNIITAGYRSSNKELKKLRKVLASS